MGRHIRLLGVDIAASVALFSLLGCVSLPGDDQILLSSGASERIVDADCRQGWWQVMLGRKDKAALDPAGFDLAIWNVQKAQRPGWSADFRWIIAGRELVLLQEAYLTRLFRTTLESSGDWWLMVRAFELNAAGTGVLTAGSVAPSAACSVRTFEPLIRVPKSALVTRYPLRGSTAELWVANLHGINFTPGTEQFRLQLESVAEVLADYDGALILAGDFNDWNPARQAILGEIAAKLGLDALRFSEDRRSRHFGRPVDHLFYRGLEALHAESVPVESSDHHPILASFRRPGGEQSTSRP
jgi:endonuclease/exonuclease/phosphatase (EEP) superfamily protein YafD